MSCGNGSCGCGNGEEKKLKKDGTACCGADCGSCDDCDCQWNEETQSCSCGGTCPCHEELSEWGCCGGGCGCWDGDGIMISEEDFSALQEIMGQFDEGEEPSEEAMAQVEEILKKYQS